ncbi:MAG: hypothetical protein AAFX98_03450 [Pseudomonadota bacterium]
MYPQHGKTRTEIRAGSIFIKLAMVLTLAVSTLITLAGIPTFASVGVMTDSEILAMATMIAAPESSSMISGPMSVTLMTVGFVVMVGAAAVFGHSLKQNLATAGRVRP